MAINDVILGLMVGGYFIALGLGIKGVQPENLRGNKWLLGFGVAIIIGNFLLAYFDGKVVDAKVTPQQVVDGIKTKLTLPLQIDAVLRLESVSAGTDRVLYNFSIAAESVEAYEKKTAELREFLLKKGCQQPDGIALLKSGYAVQMNYAAPAALGISDAQAVLFPKDCGYVSPEQVAAGQQK